MSRLQADEQDILASPSPAPLSDDEEADEDEVFFGAPTVREQVSFKEGYLCMYCLARPSTILLENPMHLL